MFEVALTQSAAEDLTYFDKADQKLMKTIDLPLRPLTLQELLTIAHEEPVILRTSEGEEYVIGAVEDFQQEVELMRANPALMRLLDERSREPANVSLDSIRPRSS